MTLFILPIVVEELYSVVWVPILYFFASYFLFLNFPCVAESLHKTPIYFEDLKIVEKDVTHDTFQKAYSIIMNFILSIIVGFVADYVIINGIRDKSIIEIFAIIGGNLFLFFKIQSQAGRILISACHYFKDNKVVRESIDVIVVELAEAPIKITVI